MNKKYDFSNVKIKNELAEQINDFLQSDLAKRRGFRSRADFISKASRKLLKEQQPRFEHLNMMEDNVKVVDFTANRIATIYFKNPGGVRCDLCNDAHCEHITYALAQPDIQRALEERGWKQQPNGAFPLVDIVTHLSIDEQRIYTYLNAHRGIAVSESQIATGVKIGSKSSRFATALRRLKQLNLITETKEGVKIDG